jgi:hypothetical protein
MKVFEGLDELRKSITINQYKLDKECITHAKRYQQAHEIYMELKDDVSAIRDKLNLERALADTRARDAINEAGGKVTEALVASIAAKDEAVLALCNELRVAEYNAGVVQGIIQAFDHRKSQLDNLVKLFIANYWALPTDTMNRAVHEGTSDSVRKNLKDKGKA